MSQTWDTIDGDTDTLAVSDDLINANFATLKSSFSGSSAPSSPVTGQAYINTGDNGLYYYTGSEWILIAYIDKTYGGTLPLSGTQTYAMTGNLYLGSNQVKGVASPTDDTDAATKGWVRDSMIDTHDHTGATGSGDKINWYTGLKSTTDITGNTIVQINAAKDGLQNRHFGNGGTFAGVSVPAAAWTTLTSVAVWKWSNEKTIILFSVSGITVDALDTAQLRITCDGAVLTGGGPYVLNSATNTHSVSWMTILTAPTVAASPYGASYTWAVQGYHAAIPTQTWYYPCVVVL